MIDEKELTFESAIERLENIVEKLEEGPPLEESIKLFEEGMSLIKFCEDKLKNAERRIEKLVKRENGEIFFEKFEEE